MNINAFDQSLWGWNLNLSSSTTYGDDIPSERLTNINTDTIPSACNNGFSSTNQYGYACPHMMMFSSDMILASIHDGINKYFWYAMGGSSNDDECGKCYQIKLHDAERVWSPSLSKKDVIVQIFNSGFDVMEGQFDLYMGAGGFGYFTSCNNDCQSQYCQGGPCRKGLYDTSFENWNQAHYNDPNQCYSGGIKWLNETDNLYISSLCRNLIQSIDNYKDLALYESCYYSNLFLYHQNFVNIDYTRVKCPDGITKLSGLKRKDDDNFPEPHLENVLNGKCQGSREQGRYCITTMQDCCKPSCSWSNKGFPDDKWSKMDTCDENGFIYSLNRFPQGG
jgi:hypothetical protein